MSDLLKSSSSESISSAFERDNIVATLKTLAWVVPLTVLIWIYAEREQLYKTENPIAIPIEVASGDPTRVVTLIRPAEKMVMADLEGPRSRVDYVRSEFSRSEKPASIKVVVDPKFTPGQPHDVTAVPELQRDALFENNSVKITNCQPPILTVFVDTYEELEVPVDVPPSVTNLVGRPTFQPAKVRLRAPSKAVDKVRSSGPLVAYADLASSGELRTPGVHENAAVRVFVAGLDAASEVVISPNTVKATLEVRQADVTYTIRSVPISVSGQVSLMKRYRVECSDTISNIKVVGPANLIEMISSGARPATAILEIKPEDTPTGSGGGAGTRTLHYDLPDGVRVASDDATRTVDFKLIERATEQ